MKKLILAVILLLPFMAWQQANAAEKIGTVSKAGITCTGKLPAKISDRFEKHVKRACEHRGYCVIRATYVSGAKKFARYGCSNFYVVAKCGSKTAEFRSAAMKGKLKIACR